MKLIRPVAFAAATPFTRASTATYYDSTGIMRTAAVDTPRYGYDPNALAVPPILVAEGAATNRAIQSADFSTSWTTALASVTVNAATAPDGTVTMDKILETTGNGVHRVFQDFTGNTIGTWVLFSAVVKAAERTCFLMSTTGNVASAWFDTVAKTANGTVGSAPVTQGMTTLGGGLYRVWMLIAVAANATMRLSLSPCDNTGNGSYVGTAASGILVWGAQWEVLASIPTNLALVAPSSYIPTTTVTVTRAADVVPAFMTNVVESPPAAYAGGTTYAYGQTAFVQNGLFDDVYTSLQPGNIGHAPASSPTWWKKTGSTYPVYNVGTTYALGDIVIDPVAHHAYESLQVSNHGNPLGVVGSTWWLDLGADNAYAMFDGSVTSQTTNPDIIAITSIQAGALIDSIGLLNISASLVRIVVTDPTEGVVYDKSYSLISSSGIQDWYAYFYEPVVRLADLLATDLLPYASARVSITAIDPGNVVAIGAALMGLSKEIGDTQFGASVGIKDYSVKGTDDFGNATVVERPFSKTGDFTVFVKAGFTDQLESLLATYRAIPILYVGDSSGTYTSTIVYGFYKSFSTVIQYWNYSVLSITIEGLA